MKTIEIKLFQFDELSDESKQRAIEKWRDDEIEKEFFGTEEYIGSIEMGLKAFDAKLNNYSIDSLSAAGSWWRIDVSEPEGDIYGQRLRTWIVNNYWSVLYEKKPYGKYEKDANGTWKYQRRSRIIETESDCPFTGYCGDYDFLDPMRKFIKQPNEGQTFKDLLNECVESTLYALQMDAEYQNSDEAITETIRANGYDFTEDGEMY